MPTSESPKLPTNRPSHCAGFRFSDPISRPEFHNKKKCHNDLAVNFSKRLFHLTFPSFT